MKPKTATMRPAGLDYEVRIVGAKPRPLRDFYHALLGSGWPTTLAFAGLVFIVANALFALGFEISGGVANARAGSFADAFFFSVQTMATIGYGAMYPQTFAAHTLVVSGAIVGMVLTALLTGLMFAKFSRPTARIVFTEFATVSPVNGAPTLTLRVGNERGNLLVDAQFRVGLTQTERTSEGQTFYRMTDLQLTRDRAPSLARSWNVMHVIDERSPQFGKTPEDLKRIEAELSVMVVGLDDTTMQPMHANQRYDAAHIVYGARHADVISEIPEGLVIDLRNFDALVPTEATPTFSYSMKEPSPV